MKLCVNIGVKRNLIQRSMWRAAYSFVFSFMQRNAEFCCEKQMTKKLERLAKYSFVFYQKEDKKMIQYFFSPDR